jgi:putative chitinase
MHWQMNHNTFNNPATADFVTRKIRGDGWSTFRRGDSGGGETTTPPPAADVLARATGLSAARAAEILPALRDGLKESACTNSNRIAMWLAQMGHESDSFRATEEYQNGPMDQERWIYKGRTWIQITWRTNYLGFGTWCAARGLVDRASFFVDNPRSLAELKWAGLGPAWYWTVARPDINALSDARDIVTVTQRINGGQNGIADRRTRYTRALALGDQLLALTTDTPTAPPPPGGGGTMSADVERMVREIHGALFNRVPSQSMYATPGEGAVWQPVQFITNGDGMTHTLYVEAAARAGDLSELARVARVAAGGGVRADEWAIARAKGILAQIERDNPEYLETFLKDGV